MRKYFIFLSSLIIIFYFVFSESMFAQIGFVPIWGPVCTNIQPIFEAQWYPNLGDFIDGNNRLGPDRNGGSGCSLNVRPYIDNPLGPLHSETPYQNFGTISDKLRLEFDLSGQNNELLYIDVFFKRGIFPVGQSSFQITKESNWTRRAFLIENISWYDNVKIRFANPFTETAFFTFIDNVILDQALPIPPPTATGTPSPTPTGTITATATITATPPITSTPSLPQACPAEPNYQDLNYPLTYMDSWNCPTCVTEPNGYLKTANGGIISTTIIPPASHKAYFIRLIGDEGNGRNYYFNGLGVGYNFFDTPFGPTKFDMSELVAQGSVLNGVLSYTTVARGWYSATEIIATTNLTRSNEWLRDPQGNGIDYPTWRLYYTNTTTALNFGSKEVGGGYNFDPYPTASEVIICTNVLIDSRLGLTQTITPTLNIKRNDVGGFQGGAVIGENDLSAIVSIPKITYLTDQTITMSMIIKTTPVPTFYLKTASLCVLIDGPNDVLFTDIDPDPSYICPSNDCALCDPNLLLPTTTPPPPTSTPTLTATATLTATIIPSTPLPTDVPTQTPPAPPPTPTLHPTPATTPTPPPITSTTSSGDWVAEYSYIESFCTWIIPAINLNGLGIPGLNFNFKGFAICFDFYSFTIVIWGVIFPVYSLAVAMPFILVYKVFVWSSS